MPPKPTGYSPARSSPPAPKKKNSRCARSPPHPRTGEHELPKVSAAAPRPAAGRSLSSGTVPLRQYSGTSAPLADAPVRHVCHPPTRRPSTAPDQALSNMDKRKTVKAHWDPMAHKIFLDICVEEVNANNRTQGYLSPLGYENMVRKFNERTKRNFIRKQFKNRWEALKKDYNVWKTLNQKASGIGIDPVTKSIAASDEWWENEIQRNDLATKFQYALLADEDKMSLIFDDHSVTNEYARVAPPSSQVKGERIVRSVLTMQLLEFEASSCWHISSGRLSSDPPELKALPLLFACYCSLLVLVTLNSAAPLPLA